MVSPISQFGIQDLRLLEQQYVRDIVLFVGEVAASASNSTTRFQIENVGLNPGEFVDFAVQFYTGQNGNTFRRITGNSDESITVSPALNAVPQEGDIFGIVELPMKRTQSGIIKAVTVNDVFEPSTTTQIPTNTDTWVPDQWAGYYVRVVAATLGLSGEWAQITGNTARSLQLATPLSQALSNGDQVLIFDLFGSPNQPTDVDPVNTMQTSVASTTNPLAASGVYESPSFDVTRWGAITGTVFADQDGEIRIQQSSDGGANWDGEEAITYFADDKQQFEVPVLAPLARIVFENTSATAQSAFRLYTHLRRVSGA